MAVTTTYTKIVGTPFAKNFATGYPLSNLTDASTTTAWTSNSDVVANPSDAFVGISFSAASIISRLVLSVASWPSVIKIGYSTADVAPTSVAGFTPIKSINTITDKDSAGAAFSRSVPATIDLPEYPAAKHIAIYADGELLLGPYSDGYVEGTSSPWPSTGRLSVSDFNAYTREDWEDGFPNDTTLHGSFLNVIETARASADAGSSFNAAKAFDVSDTTYWAGPSVGVNSKNEFIGAVLNSLGCVAKVRIRFRSWGTKIKFGYFQTNWETDLSKIVEVHSVDTLVSAADSVGNPWKKDRWHTIHLPLYTPASNLIIYTDDNAAGPLSYYVDRNDTLEVFGIQLFETAVEDKKFTGSDALPSNVVLPSSPYSTEVTGWDVRTEFNTAGTHQFTPRPETTLMLVVGSAAGAGGYVKYDADGNLNTVSGGVGGETLALSDGKVLMQLLGGSGKNAGTFSEFSEHDWLDRQPLNTNNGVDGPSNSLQAAIGADSLFGTGGASFTFPTNNLVRTIDFRTEALATSSVSSFGRNGTYGYYSTNKSHSSTSNITFQPISMSAGQVMEFNYGVSSESCCDKLRIYVNNTLILNVGGSTSSKVSYTCPSTGFYTIQFQYSKDGSVNTGSDMGWVTSAVLGATRIVESNSGGTGGAGRALARPMPLEIRIGQGGVGSTANYEIPETAHGTRGSGGASGGNGGDGVLIIYEYSGFLAKSFLANLELAAFNRIGATPGLYQTIYAGNQTGDSMRYAQHKLRPTTKTVFVMMIGAGGAGANPNSSSSPIRASNSKVTFGPEIIEAQGGTSAYTTYHDPSYGSSYYNRYNGAGGTFSSTMEPLLSQTGVTAGDAGIAGQYGNPGASNGSARGGSGGYGIVVFGSHSFPADRTLNLEIPPGSYLNYNYSMPGAIFIFEMDEVFGAMITSEPMLVVKTAPIAPNNISQSALLLIADKGEAPNNISQSALLMIADKGEAPNNVSQSAMLMLADKGEAPNNVSQSVLNVIKKMAVGPTMVTESVLQVVHDVAPAKIQVNQAPQYVLTESDPGRARVGQSLQSVLVEGDDPSISISQNLGILMVRQNRTIIYLMDFGVIRYPYKGLLYDSEICTVDGVDDFIDLQLEGHFPEGSTIIKNGVVMDSLSVRAVNGDTIQLRAGVMNWFDNRITLYGYIYRDGQIVREYAGYWAVLQGDLSATKRAIISVRGLYAGMLAGLAETVKASVKFINPKANMAPVRLTTSTAKGGAVNSISQVAAEAKANAMRSATLEFGLQKAAVTDWEVAEPKVAPTGSVSEFDMSVAVPAPIGLRLNLANQFQRRKIDQALPVKTSFEKRLQDSTSRNAQQYRSGLGVGSEVAQQYFIDGYKAGLIPVDQAYGYGEGHKSVYADINFVRFEAGKSASLKQQEYFYVSGMATTFVPQFFVYSPHFVSRNRDITEHEYITLERDKVVYAMQDWFGYQVPVGPAGDQDFIARGVNEESYKRSEFQNGVSANITLHGGFEWSMIQLPTGSYVNQSFTYTSVQAYPGITQSFIHVQQNVYTVNQTWTVRLNNHTLIPTTYAVSLINIQMYQMKPVVYQSGINRIDKAKYYMGFTTQAEVLEFVKNFLKPTIHQKLDGYVYRVGTDETLVCEVRGPNMPIAWLLHGG